MGYYGYMVVIACIFNIDKAHREEVLSGGKQEGQYFVLDVEVLKQTLHINRTSEPKLRNNFKAANVCIPLE